MQVTLSLVLALALSQLGASALAAEATGEFWEMTTKMEMAGMPAGMGGTPSAPAWPCRRRRCACSRARKASR
jgi:hypothetical protein